MLLGPILFMFYISDIVNINIEDKFTLFADDTTKLWNSKNNYELQHIISTDLRSLTIAIFILDISLKI